MYTVHGGSVSLGKTGWVRGRWDLPGCRALGIPSQQTAGHRSGLAASAVTLQVMWTERTLPRRDGGHLEAQMFALRWMGATIELKHIPVP